MRLRVARHTERLHQVVGFYRDGIGLTEIGGFRGHDGYDGVFLAVPGTNAHLELTAGGGHGAPAPHPESLLVLYLGDDEMVRRWDGGTSPTNNGPSWSRCCPPASCPAGRRSGPNASSSTGSAGGPAPVRRGGTHRRATGRGRPR